MAVSDSFRTFALEQLARIFPVSGRSMFGGVGIYAGGVFFALIDDDVLYFKVDDSNRPDFEALGMEPFRPFGEEGSVMQYYVVPGHVLDEVDLLDSWATKAVLAARTVRAKRR